MGLRSWWSALKSKSHVQRRPIRNRPRVEALEDRNLMAVGVLDSTFGTVGLTNFDFPPNSTGDVLTDIAIQSDGKIVAGGIRDAFSPSEDFAVIRYSDAGILDMSFGTNGVVSADFGSRDRLGTIAIAPDGKIVGAGGSGSAFAQFALARWNADGTPDNNFGGDGMVTTVVNPIHQNIGDGITDIAILPNGQIIAVGFSVFDLAIVKYNVDGTPDTNFGGGDGIVTHNLVPNDFPMAVVLQPDGKILVCGADLLATYVARFNTDGSPDADFDGDGVAMASFPGASNYGLRDLALQEDGKVVAVGFRDLGGVDFTAVRFNDDGTPDTNFGTNGYFVSNLPSNDEVAEAVTIQTDGKIIVAGRSGQASFIARLTDGGVLDPAFGTGGVTITNANAASDQINAVAMQEDGKIVAGIDANRTFSLARYLNSPLANAGGPYNTFEGVNVQLDGSGSSDPDQPANTLLYTWDLDGDDNFGETGVQAQRGEENGMTTTYLVGDQNGPSTVIVKLRVTNNGGDSYTAKARINIANTAPIATLGNGGVVSEGSPGSVSFTGQFDPSTDDTSDGFRYAYDFNNDGVWEIGDGTYAGGVTDASVAVPAQYLDDLAPSRTVKGRIIDIDDGANDYTTVITITPVNDPPTDIHLAGPHAGLEFSAANALIGKFSTTDADLSAEGDTHIYMLVDDAGGRFSLNGDQLISGAAFGFSDGATHTIRVRTTDSQNVPFEKDFVINIIPRTMPHTQGAMVVAINPAATHQVNQAGGPAWFADRDYALTFTGNYSQNYGGANEKWMQGGLNQFNNNWYFIKPTGELQAWTGEAAQASGATLAILDPIYWSLPQLLHNATAEHRAYVIDQALGLQVDNGNLYENSGARGERWLKGAVNNQFGNPWYFLTPKGTLFAWNGAIGANGALVATLPAVYYNQIAKLHDAQPGQIVATAVGGSLTIDPVPGFVGDWVIELITDDAGPTHVVQKFDFSVLNRLPEVPFVGPQTMPTSQNTLSVPVTATDPDGDSVNYLASAGHQGYVLDQLYGLYPPTFVTSPIAGTGLPINNAGTPGYGTLGIYPYFYENSYGQGEMWLKGLDNSFNNTWYFIKPSGEFYEWNGSNAASGQLLATVAPIYHQYIELLYKTQAEDLARAIDQRLGLFVDPSGLWENHLNQGERWLRGNGGSWWYIKPDGGFFRSGGPQLVDLDSAYHADVNLLAAATGGQFTAQMSGSDVIVDPVPNFIGDLWVLIEASDLNPHDRRRSTRSFRVEVTA